MRCLLLDLGGTVFVSGLERLALLGDQRPQLSAIAARRGPLGSEPDLLWDALLRGEITERAYWRVRSDEVGVALGRAGWPITEFMHLIYGGAGDVLRPAAGALVDAAREAGVRVGVLTNDLRAFHGQTAMAAHPILAAMDVVVDASVTGVLKPDPVAYTLAAEAMGAPASEIVFVDDIPANVTAARDQGMIALLLDLADPDEVFDRARDELGLGPSERIRGWA